MIAAAHHSLPIFALITLAEVAIIVRILLRPHRDPASRIAWVVIVGVLPLVGIVAYLLLGEVNIGRRRVKRLHAVLKSLPEIPSQPAGDLVDVGETGDGFGLSLSLLEGGHEDGDEEGDDTGDD